MTNKIDYSKYINFFLIGYALCLPISKAGTNIFEVLSLLFWILEGRWSEKYNLIKSNLLSLSIILLIFISLISLPYAKSVGFGINYILKYRHFLMILVMFTSLEQKYIKYLISAFLSGMFISEIISYGIFFEWWHYKNIPPSDPSPFMNHVDYSVYLAFTSSILLIRLFNYKNTIVEKVIYSLFFITVTSNLFINGGRTGQVIFIFLILYIIFYSMKRKLLSIAISLLLIVSIFTIAYSFSPTFKNRVEYLKRDVTALVKEHKYNQGTFSERVALWKLGLKEIKDSFPFGTGIGNEMNNLNKNIKYFKMDKNKFRGYADNHNTFITYTVQLGPIGLILMLFIIYSIFQLKFKNRDFQILKSAFLITFILWSMGGMTFHLMDSMIFFALFAGMLDRISYLEINSKSKIEL